MEDWYERYAEAEENDPYVDPKVFGHPDYGKAKEKMVDVNGNAVDPEVWNAEKQREKEQRTRVTILDRMPGLKKRAWLHIYNDYLDNLKLN